MSARIGQSHKLFRNTGTAGSPTWDEITAVADVELSATADASESSTRASRIRSYVAGMLDFSVTATMILVATEADYTAIRTAFFNGTALDLAIADGPIATTGTRYFRSGFVVTSFSQSEPLNGTVTLSVEFRPTEMPSVPQGYVTVT